MSICPRPRRILPGHSLFQARRHAIPHPLTPCRLSSGISQQTFHGSPHNDTHRPSNRSNRLPCPVPRGLRKDPSEWIKYLEKYIPRQNLDKDSPARGATEQKIDQEDCDAILELLYQARAQQNFDLLTILGFKFGRWQDFHAIINKLLDFADAVRPISKRGRLPSNIHWGNLGSFDGLSGEKLESIKPTDIHYHNDGMPISSFDSYSEEPVMHNQLGEAGTRIGAMDELWQSLGVFVLEAADEPTKEGSALMSHFYRVVARLHHLDMIPPEIYKYTPKLDPTLPNRPPGVHLLSYPIMSVLSDATWEATAAEDAMADPDNSPYVAPLRYRSKQLGFGVWLEFILWCCVEGGYAAGAAWILQKSRNRSRSWSVQSWARLYQAKGSIDPLKMDRYDTWAQCGVLSNEPFAGPSNRPFQGMGLRTITSEVIVAAMDGLVNSLGVGVGARGDSPSFVWERLGLLRAILSKNKIYLRQADITYLIVRILETGAIVPETKPQSLELLLNLAPYIPPTDQPTESSSPHFKGLYQQEYDPEYSGLVLGLYQYALNIYASSGHVSGTIDVFERLLGAVDPEKVFEIRNSVLDHKYLIKAHPVRQTEQNRSRNMKPASGSQNLQLSALSWTLLLDTLTSSRLYRLANWLTSSYEEALRSSTSRSREGVLIADPLIRLATATKNRELFYNVVQGLTPPLENQTLISLLNWRIGELDWKDTAELLCYLRDRKNSQWDVTNIMSLGATIFRLECQPLGECQSELDPTFEESQDETLDLAKKLLTDVLNGKFNQHYSYSTDLHTSEATLNQVHHFFSSIPGCLSDICHEVKLQWGRPIEPSYRIPSSAFNRFLSAVVDTQGSLAGKRLWDEFCIEPVTTMAKRIRTKKNMLVQTSRKRIQQADMIKPSFKAKSTHHKKTPLVSPDLTTVRIIAQAALEEQKCFWQRGPQPTYPNVNSLTPETYTAESVDRILSWSAEMFERLRLGDREINRELDGYPLRKSMPTLALTTADAN
ncbi:uncharacterized protein GIQ15_01029 [Arthroderma uncinatum]|uniref:uncharacterized protein n=1 Tax=Arthroderma uncinatum TaxID=74035 RepID=UPI00144A53BE|nr:uncharacterized protein GIQ15_01029 [Arthroderma uncinatum]KAF3491512.1 hypothetical protein GIQ15_01029 [Arthroderma uncinatum]